MTTRVDIHPTSQPHLHDTQVHDPEAFVHDGYLLMNQLQHDSSDAAIEHARAWMEQAQACLNDPSFSEKASLRDQLHHAQSALDETIRYREIEQKADGFTNQVEFLSLLDPGIQTIRRTELNRALESPTFRNLDPRLQDAVIETIAEGRGNAAEVMRAATMQFHEGIRTNARTEADRQEFTILVQRAMVNSPSFRERMFIQNEDAAHPITMGVGHSQRSIVIDSTGKEIYGVRASTHRVDLDDIARFPAVADRSRPAYTTQDQSVIHFMTEAYYEARSEHAGELEIEVSQQIERDYSIEGREEFSERPQFERGHQAGLRAENQYRQEMGLPGLVHSREGVNFDQGRMTTAPPATRYEGVRVRFNNGDVEIWELNRLNNISQTVNRQLVR